MQVQTKISERENKTCFSGARAIKDERASAVGNSRAVSITDSCDECRIGENL